MKDLQLEIIDIKKAVLSEHRRQIKKWGVQDHSSFEWMCYLTEEVGELAEAISYYEYRYGGAQEVFDEAIQVATLALKIAEMFGVEGARMKWEPWGAPDVDSVEDFRTLYLNKPLKGEIK